MKEVVGPATAVTYGADWSEYFGYHPDDGTGDVFFNLDPLWASPAVDAVGIDNYMPLSDWRDGDLVSGNPDGFETACDPGGLAAMITAGEGFDWYYASEADRQARRRTPITDGLAGTPWVFRFKDIEGWWGNAHHERTGGRQAAEPTAWVPKSKPVWFTEIGCPAVDKGANRPNVFPDPKSSESALPWFSTGARDDLVQRRFLEAHLSWWTGAGAPAGMVDPARIFAWTWDARPFPAFPFQTDLWRDGADWLTGHWLNGRLGAATAPDLIAAILDDHGFPASSVEAALGDVGGYAVSDPASARTVLEPLLDALQIDAFETAGILRFQSRARRAPATVTLDALADREEQPLVEETRAEESALASEAIIDHYDPANGYEAAAARSRRLVTGNDRQHRISLPAAMDEAAATSAADLWLRQAWSARLSLRLALSPGALALEPGDAFRLADDPAGRFLVTRIDDGAVREVTASGFVSAGAGNPGRSARDAGGSDAALVFAPLLAWLDLPVLDGTDETAWARAGAFGTPWRPVVLSASAGTEGYSQRTVLDRPAGMGVLAAPLPPGYPGRFSAGPVEVDLHAGSPASAADVAVLGGGNIMAVLCDNGAWEVLQFAGAEEIAPGRWRLTRLLRGQAGTEDAMLSGALAGARVVLLDDAVKSLNLEAGEAGLELNWSADPAGGSAGQGGVTVFSGGLRALTPLSPVHPRARRDPAGDVRVTWVRRGRINADSWLGSDIPLGESRERYLVEVMSGPAVLRSAEVSAPAFTYAAADERTDFGAPQPALTFRVRQIGDRANGLPALAVLSP